MNRIIPLIFFLIGFAGFAHGQTQSAFLKAADEAFVKKNYYAALSYYNEVIEFGDVDPKVIFKAAESARLFNAYKLATEKYSYLVDTLKDNSEPTALFYLGEMHQRQGNYLKAIEYYDLYLTQYSKDGEYMTEKAKMERISSEWANEKISEPNEDVTITRIENDVNSPYSDFSASRIDSVLYFSSMRFLEKKPKEKPARQISKLMVDREGVVMTMPDSVNETDLAVANGVFNADTSRIYYTKCEFIAESELRCDIYFADFTSDGRIENEVMIGDSINLKDYTATHPSIGKLPGSENSVLFFVSNRPGGKGKLDIWYSEFDSTDHFFPPVNLSKVNTAEDDITPFYHQISNTLYFSSDGKQGFGGHDIYYSAFVDTAFTDNIHMSAPYNSSYHDLYYRLADDYLSALFSSNREGSLFLDDYLESCCYDIYDADIKPLVLDLLALTYNKLTGDSLVGVTVDLIDPLTNQIIASLTPEDSHEHLFDIERGKNYLLIASKEGFKGDTLTFSTTQITKSENLVKKLYLEPDILVLDVYTFDKATREALEGASVTLEDLDDPSANREFQFNELSNDFHFDLERGRNYRITATRPGYNRAELEFLADGKEPRIRKDIYLEKINLSTYLPIALYFDNDHPDPDSKSTYTNKAYSSLVTNYMNRKSTFINEYIRGTQGQERTNSREEMDNFFEGEIQGGYETLHKFLDDMLVHLNSGKRIEVTIRGYASPRFDIKYNLVLAQRRIQSIKNEIASYNGGAYAKYMDSNQLIITEISFGEELAPDDVIDNINDLAGSIYSINASHQRKVVIVSVDVK